MIKLSRCAEINSWNIIRNLICSFYWFGKMGIEIECLSSQHLCGLITVSLCCSPLIVKFRIWCTFYCQLLVVNTLDCLSIHNFFWQWENNVSFLWLRSIAIIYRNFELLSFCTLAVNLPFFQLVCILTVLITDNKARQCLKCTLRIYNTVSISNDGQTIW